MEKWNILRAFIAKEHEEITEKYLKTSQTGDKAEKAKTATATLRTVWNAMDKIDEMEKKENEPSDNDGKPNEEPRTLFDTIIKDDSKV